MYAKDQKAALTKSSTAVKKVTADPIYGMSIQDRRKALQLIRKRWNSASPADPVYISDKLQLNESDTDVRTTTLGKPIDLTYEQFALVFTTIQLNKRQRRARDTKSKDIITVV